MEGQVAKMEQALVRMEQALAKMAQALAKMEQAIAGMEGQLPEMEVPIGKMEEILVRMEQATARMEQIITKVEEQHVKMEDQLLVGMEAITETSRKLQVDLGPALVVAWMCALLKPALLLSSPEPTKSALPSARKDANVLYTLHTIQMLKKIYR